MLCADSMPSPYNAPLEKRKSGFDGVGVGVAVNVMSPLVPDSLVFCGDSHALGDAAIHVKIIREKHLEILTQIFANELLNDSAPHVPGMKEAQIAIALADADNGFLLRTASAIVNPFAFSPYVGFIHFDLPAEFGALHLNHCRANAVTEIPRGLIPADFQDALNLECGDAFLRFAHDECGDEPLGQREVRIVENRSGGDGELSVARRAAQHRFPVHHAGDIFAIALRAGGAFWPTQPFEVLAALDFAVELRHKLRKPNTRQNSRHGQSPMKKRKKSDRQVLREIFPPEIVREVDATLADLNPKHKQRSNPSGKPIKAWTKGWVKGREPK